MAGLKITPARATRLFVPPPTALAVCEILYTSKDCSSFRLQLLEPSLGIMSSLAPATLPLHSAQPEWFAESRVSTSGHFRAQMLFQQDETRSNTWEQDCKASQAPKGLNTRGHQRSCWLKHFALCLLGWFANRVVPWGQTSITSLDKNHLKLLLDDWKEKRVDFTSHPRSFFVPLMDRWPTIDHVPHHTNQGVKNGVSHYQPRFQVKPLWDLASHHHVTYWDQLRQDVSGR